MRNPKGFVSSLVFALGLALSSVGFAQNPAPSDQKKEADSCCAMSCCSGDSCLTMKHDQKNHAAKDASCCGDSCSTMKHDASNQAAKEGCCCSSGDSCAMDMKDMKEKPKQ